MVSLCLPPLFPSFLFSHSTTSCATARGSTCSTRPTFKTSTYPITVWRCLLPIALTVWRPFPEQAFLRSIQTWGSTVFPCFGDSISPATAFPPPSLSCAVRGATYGSFASSYRARTKPTTTRRTRNAGFLGRSQRRGRTCRNSVI